MEDSNSAVFAFARERDWKKQLDEGKLSSVSALLKDYDACLSRIRACKVPVKDYRRKSGIDRIFYARGQEDVYDSEELYALFQQLPPDRMRDLRQAIIEQQWHFMTEAQREEFLREWLPEAADYYDLLSDFRHVHRVAAFIRDNPDKVYSGVPKKAETIEKNFDKAWRDKVVQMQIPLFNAGTKGQWGLRFDDILANALEQGQLSNTEPELPPELMERLRMFTPKGVPLEMVCTLVAYYRVNKPADSDWVVLPVASFDAYFGTTSFGRKYLKQMPPTILERSDTGFGLCRYKVTFL